MPAVSNTKDNEKKTSQSPSQQSDISSAQIPQIILTEPSTSQEPTIHSVGIESPQGLSPKATNAASIPTPLPLTKDLLQRKNKLDRLLSLKEKRRHQHRSTEVFSSNAAVDERVTAGLGISTPNENNGLRSRRQSASRISNRSDVEKSMTTAFNPSSSLNQQSHSEWSYDLDMYKSHTSGSSKGHHQQQQDYYNHRHHHKRTSGTPASRSSNRNSVSMRAYSANHRYMDNKLHNHHDRSNYYFERPDQPLKKDNKSKYYLLDLLYCAVIRVVNSRAPESKEVASHEIFDFSHEEQNNPTIKPPDQDEIPFTITDSHNEKAILETTSPHLSTRNHRFSMLSGTTSLDEKSFDFDNESLAYHTNSLEKKSSVKHDLHIPPTPMKKPLSQSDKILPNPLQGNSLFFLEPHNPLRISAWQFIRSTYVYGQNKLF